MRIAISQLRRHPDNPNSMSSEDFAKLVANMGRQQNCPAIDVREMPDGTFQILDGHHRVRAAIQLGWNDIPAHNWGPISDEQARLLLLTLNRLRGKDDRRKRKSLLQKLQSAFDVPLSDLVPESAEQLQKSFSPSPPVNDFEDERLADSSEPYSVLVESDWKRTIDQAVKLCKEKFPAVNLPSRETHGALADDLRRGAALHVICAFFIDRA